MLVISEMWFHKYNAKDNRKNIGMQKEKCMRTISGMVHQIPMVSSFLMGLDLSAYF